MNFFRRNKKATSAIADYSVLGTDIHSHLLPGIDDGSPDMETSLHLIQGLVSLGYKKLITTPHIMWDMYQNRHEDIRQKLSQLELAVKEAGIDVKIEAAAEYFLDDHVVDLLNKKEPLLTIGGKMVLVEFSLAHLSMGLK